MVSQAPQDNEVFWKIDREMIQHELDNTNRGFPELTPEQASQVFASAFDRWADTGIYSTIMDYFIEAADDLLGSAAPSAE